MQTHPIVCYNALSDTTTPFLSPEPKVMDERGVHSSIQRYWALPGDHCVYVFEYKEKEQEWQ